MIRTACRCALLLAALIVAPATTSAQESLTWDHIHLGVPDAAAATEWYVTYLDAARRPDGQPGVFFGPTRFNMRVTAKPVPSDGSVIDHVGLSYADVDASVKRLAGSGARILEAPHDVPGLHRRAVVQDPWGVKIELVQDPATLGFHHVHARATEPAQMLGWFAAHLGGQRGRMHGRMDGLNYGGVWLVVDRAEAAPISGENNAIDHLGFRTRDLGALVGFLRSKGVKATDPRPDRLAATTSAAFADGTPAGRIELTQR
jgi:catechol 2,3-dioxygenase-like lactoylglutathione lyase family enzyme